MKVLWILEFFPQEDDDLGESIPIAKFERKKDAAYARGFLSTNTGGVYDVKLYSRTPERWDGKELERLPKNPSPKSLKLAYFNEL